MDNAVEAAQKINVDTDLNSFVKFVDQKMNDRSTPFKPFYSPKITKEIKLDSKNLVCYHFSLDKNFENCPVEAHIRALYLKVLLHTAETRIAMKLVC